MKTILTYIVAAATFLLMWAGMVLTALLMPILTLLRIEVKMKITRK